MGKQELLAQYPGCQLADTYEKGTWKEHAGKRRVVEPKMDGYRLNILMGDGEGVICCRGNEEPDWAANLAHFVDELVALGFKSCLVDAEVMASTWGKTGIVRKKASPQVLAEIKATVFCHVFDWVPLGKLTWHEAKRAKLLRCEIPAWSRRAILTTKLLEGALADELVAPHIRLVPQWEVGSEEELYRLRDEQMKKPGGEGVMLKDPEAPYTMDRGHGWWKVVPMRSFDLRCTGAVEGTGKHKGRLGSLIGKTMDGRDTEVRAGTGFEDKNREELWAIRDQLPGRIFEVEARVSDVATARHPVFKRWRLERIAV